MRLEDAGALETLDAAQDELRDAARDDAARDELRDAARDAPPDAASGLDAGPPPERRVGPVVWLLDGESGRLGYHSRADPRRDPYDTARVFACPDAVQLTSEPPIYSGRHAFALSLDSAWRFGPGGCAGAVRTLVSSNWVMSSPEDGETWTGFAMFIPEDWDYPGRDYYVAAYHESNGGAGLYMWLTAGGDLVYRSNPPGELFPEQRLVEAAPRGVWLEIVTHARLSRSRGGWIRIWYRPRGAPEWRQVMNFAGKTVPDAADFGFHVRIALATEDTRWRDPARSRVLFFDEVRAAYGDARFEDVQPGSGIVPRGL